MEKQVALPWFVFWLKKVFPITRKERKKVFLLLVLKFLISFVYCILTSLKDTILVTANHSAAEVIPIVKGSLIFPISVAVLVLYTKLSNHLKQATLFYSTVLFFFTFVLLYGFVLYPNSGSVSPHATADFLSACTGGKHLHWIAVFRHWIHVLFFIFAELWGQLVLMVLYWSFVNNVCNIYDAKRFYALFIAAGDVALIVTAPLIVSYTKKYKHMGFLFTVQALLVYVALLCLLIIVTYTWANCVVQPNTGGPNPSIPNKKLRLSLWASLKHVASSRYLMGLGTMMVACSLSINLVEGTWKSYLKETFSKSCDYQMFTSKISFWTGVLALVTSLFFSGGILRKLGWKATARIAPITVGTMGCLFFFLSYTRTNLGLLSHGIGSNPVLYLVIFGGIQNVTAKVVKYTFYDKTTQMAYIPLDPESKVKGKAAVDMLGSRLGKAGSSWIQIILLELFHTNSIQPLSGVLFVFLLVTTILWYRATYEVGQQLAVLEKTEADTLASKTV